MSLKTWKNKYSLILNIKALIAHLNLLLSDIFNKYSICSFGLKVPYSMDGFNVSSEILTQIFFILKFELGLLKIILFSQNTSKNIIPKDQASYSHLLVILESLMNVCEPSQLHIYS